MGIPKNPGLEKAAANWAIGSFRKQTQAARIARVRVTAAKRALSSSPVIRSGVRSTKKPLMITAGRDRFTKMLPMLLLPSRLIFPERNISAPIPASRNMMTT